MKRLMMIAALGSISLIMGCTSAGPYVTNIRPDYHGNLVIEREKIHFIPLLGPLMPIGRLDTETVPPLTIPIMPEGKQSESK